MMITKHHIDLIQVPNSLDLKITTGPLWGPRVQYIHVYLYAYLDVQTCIPVLFSKGSSATNQLLYIC